MDLEEMWTAKQGTREKKRGKPLKFIVISVVQNHRTVWVGKDLGGHPVQTPLPWAGTTSTRPGCAELHPTWP